MVNIRKGVVLGRDGGAFYPMKLAFSLVGQRQNVHATFALNVCVLPNLGTGRARGLRRTTFPLDPLGLG